ncbi:transcriptional regulator [Paraburkholderia rhizosphaerae]|uniref:Transcriptional regulator n=2 Tax=Paraburkholderia rhizosphaerae TaxID=480658 RepID=A0A4R8LGH7_9BURK|nr:transcriptional regulator [Paraburkholderia rhizosphaerae]
MVMLPIFPSANISASANTIGVNMMALLLLDDDVRKRSEVFHLFSNAGYQVNDGHAADALHVDSAGGALCKTVTIWQVDDKHPFPLYIASLARGTNPPWRLSLHQHTLVAPNRSCTRLTSLEFALVKVFALSEKGEVVSRKRIIDEFGEHYLSYDQNRLDTTVMRLRKKVRDRLGTSLPLNTVRVRGFSFDDWLILDH